MYVAFYMLGSVPGRWDKNIDVFSVYMYICMLHSTCWAPPPVPANGFFCVQTQHHDFSKHYVHPLIPLHFKKYYLFWCLDILAMASFLFPFFRRSVDRGVKRFPQDEDRG